MSTRYLSGNPTRILIRLLLVIACLTLGMGGTAARVETASGAAPTFSLAPDHGPCNQEIVARGTNLSPGGNFVIDGPRDEQGKELTKQLGTQMKPDGVVGPDGTITVRIVPCTVSTIVQPFSVSFGVVDYNTATGASVRFTIEPTRVPGIPNTGAGGMHDPSNRISLALLVGMILGLGLFGSIAAIGGHWRRQA